MTRLPMPTHNAITYCTDATCERSVRPRLSTRPFRPGRNQEPCGPECAANVRAQRAAS